MIITHMKEEAPSSWSQKPIYTVASAYSTGLTMEDVSDLGTPVYDAKGLVGFTSSEPVGMPYFTIIKDGAGIGKVRLMESDTTFLGTMNGIAAKQSIELKYLFYVFEQSSFLLENITTIPHIYFSDYSKEKIYVPPINTQRRIVAFLDEETAKIDALIAKQQHLIDLLDERNSVIWYQLFTGYEPVRHLPLKRVLRKLDRPANPETGVITAYRDGVVTLRSNRREEGYTFSETESGYQGIEPGDLVFHGLDGFAGSVGVSDSEGRSTPVYHVCETIDEDDIVFLAKYLRYLGKTGYLATQAPNVRQRSVDFRNWDRFGRLPLSLPDIQTQHVIVEKIESAHEGNEQAKERIAREISLLQERRSALITAAVTGQIEV
ncbi:MAG: restriction endonuclease subunit S [Mobiluncus sp.]|uniref:restriction endonuclease subunit S n=1 Tax=Mobiluncus sp. TaxID=47293 RepID=UPI00258F2015|nr:restriction endonuclease subunit S [Mobiluncus sp.]MCI6583720.1 restriction endonuclease subunit S [Mobiluncus sp.]